MGNKMEKNNKYWLEIDKEFRLQTRYTCPIVLDQGQGVYLWDVEGKRYLDFESGQFCVSVGHCHPRYVEALCHQAQRLMQTGSVFTVPAQALLAKKLAEFLAPPLKKSFFACSGTEANEAALRLAKFYTGRHEIVALMRGFGGMTLGSISITGFGGSMRKGYGPSMPGVAFIPEPYCYRCEFNETYPGCNLSCLRFAERVIDLTTSGTPAALFIEVVMSAAGVIVAPVEWVQGIRRLCEKKGMLLAFDESQTALGRTGKWFAYEHVGVVPDIITISKSIGGGIPLSSMTTTAAIAEAVEAKGHLQSSTHTGDPLLCATGLANIEIIETEGLVKNVAEVGAYFKVGLEEIMANHRIVGDVRGLGLLLGMEIVKDKESKVPNVAGASGITLYCRDKGLLLSHRPGLGAGENVIRISPPFILTREVADTALQIINEAVREVESGRYVFTPEF